MVSDSSLNAGGRVPLINAANGLTLIRVVLVPIFILSVVISDMDDEIWRIASCLVFCFAAATDYADGWIARRWNLVTSFGKIADPIADKALIGSALILLSGYGLIPWWMTIVILVRELGVTALRFWVIRRTVIAASYGGKIKTVLQGFAITWYLVPLPPIIAWMGWWVVLAATIVTVVTGLDYLIKATSLGSTREKPYRADAGTSDDTSASFIRKEVA